MYDFIDQRVPALDRGGQFLIWSVRHWANAINNRQYPPRVVGPAFAKWGVIAALPHFQNLMMILGKDGLQTLQISPTNSLQVNDDEALLLSLFRAPHCESAESLNALVGLLVEEDAVTALSAAVWAVSARLAEMNLIPLAPQRCSTGAKTLGD